MWGNDLPLATVDVALENTKQKRSTTEKQGSEAKPPQYHIETELKISRQFSSILFNIMMSGCVRTPN